MVSESNGHEGDEEVNEREAEAEFEAAIAKYMAALGQREGLVVDWFLITAEHVDTGHDRTMTAYGYYGPHAQRLHNGLGLLNYAQLRLQERTQRTIDDDED